MKNFLDFQNGNTAGVINVSFLKDIQCLLFSNVGVDVFQEDIVSVKVELLIFGGVTETVEDFGEVEIVGLDVESQFAHDLFELVFKALVCALIVEETVENWV